MNSNTQQSEPPRPLTLAVRGALYVGLNALVLIALFIGATLSKSSDPRLAYSVAMTTLCSIPILWMDRLNGAYFLLATYLAFAYVYFAFGDVMQILLGRPTVGDGRLLSGAELVIIVSMLGVIAGYRIAVRFSRSASNSVAPRDWRLGSIIAVGLAAWLVGTAGMMYWQVFVIADRSNSTLIKNINALGTGATTLFMLAQLIQPLGIVILTYGYAAFRRAFLLPLVIVVVVTQIFLGFVADFKSEAMSAGLLVIIAKSYVDGRVPKIWLACAGLFVVLAFPVFQAQRLAVRGDLGRSAADALLHLTDTIKESFAALGKTQSGFGGAEYRVQAFWERASLKGSVDLIVRKTGTEVPYQDGATLTPLLTAFVPRILWADKDSVAVGQVMNKSFHVSSVQDVYISPSHVGEIYWNFGWMGTLTLLPLTGLLLGFIGSRCAGYPNLSLTRLMVMIVTIVAFVVRSEGSIASEYVVWLRSMAAIGLLHVLFARKRAKAVPQAAALEHSLVPARPFPNLLA